MPGEPGRGLAVPGRDRPAALVVEREVGQPDPQRRGGESERRALVETRVCT